MISWFQEIPMFPNRCPYIASKYVIRDFSLIIQIHPIFPQIV